MISGELRSVIEKLIAAELGPKEGRYELLFPQELESSIEVIAVDEIQDDLPKPIQYHSKFASMLARKSLSELIQPEMIPLNISNLQVSVNKLEHYQFSLGLKCLDSKFNYGHAPIRIGYYDNPLKMKTAQEKSNGITSAISTEQNNFLFTVLGGCITLYVPRLLGDNIAKEVALESSIHETVHAMTIPTVILEILNRIKFPVDNDYIAAKLQSPSELVAHALTPYIIRQYTKNNADFEIYAEHINERIKSPGNKVYCDYSAVSEILSTNETLEDAFNECIDRIRLNRRT